MAFGRYFRLFAALGRFSLATEMAYRANFLVRILVEVLWLAMLLGFYKIIFGKASNVVGWTEEQFFFFIGCHYTLGGVIDTFFLENCTELSELVRLGDLDFYLLKPIDEQFLITCRRIDWATMPNIFLGIVLMGVALVQMNWEFDPVRALLFPMLFACGVAMAYSFLLILCASSLWLVRNQNLMELWWLFTNLMRHPREIFSKENGGTFAILFGQFFTFAIPVLLVISVPASTMVKNLFDPWMVALMMASSVVLFAGSRWFFRFALRSYRSASS
jgi:ABC-2 type transport system permease protein